MDQKVIDKTPYRREHTTRRRENQVENIFRARPFRQDSIDKALF